MTPQPQIRELSAQHAVIARASTDRAGMRATVDRAFATLFAELARLGVEPAGAPRGDQAPPLLVDLGVSRAPHAGALVLSSRESTLQATFVPDAGVVCCSLRHEGEELLAQREGVDAYASRGATMGIPLLYPWA